MKNLVSVITTTYNSLDYLQANIDSIRRQKYSEIEHIIVDDGSNDGTEDFLSKIEDENIKCIVIPRSGRGRALNIALAHSSGEYIAILDADDVSHDERIDAQVRFFKNHHDCDLLCTEYTTHLKTLDKETGNKSSFQRLSAQDFLIKNPICHSSVMMKRNVFPSDRFYDDNLKRLLDLNLWMRLLKREDVSFYKMQRPLVFKRIHNEQYFERRNRFAYLKDIFYLKLDLIHHFQFTFWKKILIMFVFAYGMLPRNLRRLWMGKK